MDLIGVAGGGFGRLDQAAATGRERNRQGLENRIIVPEVGPAEAGEMNCRERLGGLLRNYHRDAAWKRRFEFLDTTGLR